MVEIDFYPLQVAGQVQPIRTGVEARAEIDDHIDVAPHGFGDVPIDNPGAQAHRPRHGAFNAHVTRQLFPAFPSQHLGQRVVKQGVLALALLPAKIGHPEGRIRNVFDLFAHGALLLRGAGLRRNGRAEQAKSFHGRLRVLRQLARQFVGGQGVRQGGGLARP